MNTTAFPPVAWGAPARPATHEARTTFDIRIPMRDGITLSADVTCPVDAGAGPAIIIRTPYNKNHVPEAGRYFAGRGYAYVEVDVRGRGDSDGVFTPYCNDAVDGYDVIEWVAGQPWCDGQVGTLGGSY